MVNFSSIFPAGNSKGLTAAYFRAYADVMVEYLGIQSATVQCLVDTGADYTILPDHIVQNIGISTITSHKASFRTAGGTSYSLPLIRNVELIVEGYHFQSDIAVSSSQGFTSLLGRIELITAFDSGLDYNNWFWG